MGIIPKGLQLQAQVTILSLGWRYKAGECAQSVCS